MREAQIKAALIDRLFLDGFIDNETVLISELPVASWSRRADLVLANGKILGFEIKSKFDSTARLAAQLEAYAGSFEGVSVVIDQKHVANVEKIASEAVGIFTIIDGPIKPTITMVRKPRVRALSLDAAMRLMVVSDLRELLRSEGRALDRSYGRQRIEVEARTLPLQTIRNWAVNALKKRYAAYHGQFLSSREESHSTVAALPALRRPSWTSTTASAKIEETSHSASAIPVPAQRLIVTPRRLS
jgi:hypothetical protein